MPEHTIGVWRTWHDTNRLQTPWGVIRSRGEGRVADQWDNYRTQREARAVAVWLNGDMRAPEPHLPAHLCDLTTWQRAGRP
jgi:hypothetical protein